MPARRQLLLAGVFTAFAAREAWSAPRRAPARSRRAPERTPQNAEQPQQRATPATTPLGPLDVQAREAIIIDFNTGAVLLEKNPDEPMPPSSMSKLMTAYVVFSMLREGRLQLDQTLPVSERAWRMQGSKMFVQIGTQVSVDDLIHGMMIQSGNDACIVLEEAIAGGESGFAELLNETARKIGLQNSSFRNSTGWPDPEHWMTCRDLAILARRLIVDFPEYYRLYAERSFTYNGIQQGNRNPLVQRGLADGLKTGHTDAAGYGLTASAERNGRRVILVANGWTSMSQRAEESERLIEWAFREFENVTLFAPGQPAGEAQVWLGASRTVPLVSGPDGLVVTMPRAWRRTATVKMEYEGPVPAPIRRGDPIGFLTTSGRGVPDLRVPLYAGADVGRQGILGRATVSLLHMVGLR